MELQNKRQPQGGQISPRINYPIKLLARDHDFSRVFLLVQNHFSKTKFNNECNNGQNAAKNKLERFEVGNDKSAVDNCTILENLKEKANNVMDIQTEKTPCANVNDSKDEDKIQTFGNKTFINTSDSKGSQKIPKITIQM